jgi:hypothetical protein
MTQRLPRDDRHTDRPIPGPGLFGGVAQFAGQLEHLVVHDPLVRRRVSAHRMNRTGFDGGVWLTGYHRQSTDVVP